MNTAMLGLPLSGSLIQTALIGLVAGLAAYCYLKYRKYNMPPGPLRLPILGNMLQLGSDRRYHIKFYEWSKRYGPTITVGLGPIRLVVVNNIDSAMEVLVKRSTDFAGRQHSPSLRYLTNGYKDIAMVDQSPTWKLHRRISSKALRHYIQGGELEQRLHSGLQTTFPVLEEMKGAFDPEEVINFLVTNIIVGLCFHGKYEYGNAEIREVIKLKDEFNDLFNNFIPEDLFPPLQYVYTSRSMRRMQNLVNALNNTFIANKFYEQKKTFNKGKIRSLADTLILARKEAEEEEGKDAESLTDEYLIQTLSDSFFAGIDTTRLTLKFSILHMIAFPDIQKKVQEELDRVIGKERLPGVKDRPNLGYTEAVLHESMRMASVTPSGLFHRTMKDTEISGYKIPKDVLVMINHWALHHDPGAWSEVDKFKPERYLDENGRLGPKPQNWLPFSAGKRVCMGEFVAKPELHLLFAGLMQRFTWTAESGVTVKTEAEGTLVLGLPPPFKVQIERRT